MNDRPTYHYRHCRFKYDVDGKDCAECNKLDASFRENAGVATHVAVLQRDLEDLKRFVREMYLDHEAGGLMHGDAEHRAWLKDYLDKQFAGRLL